MIENRLTEYLEDRQAALPVRRGDLDAVVRRGHRRAIATRAAYGLAAAATVVVVVAGSAAFLRSGRTVEPELAPPAAPGEDSFVVGSLGPEPQVTPPGTEVRLAELGMPIAADRAGLDEAIAGTGDLEVPEDRVLYGIGEVEGARVFLVPGTEPGTGAARVCIVGIVGNGFTTHCGLAGASGWGAPSSRSGDGTTEVFSGLVPDFTSYVVVRAGDTVLWQRPVSQVVWIPLEGEPGPFTVEMYDATGRRFGSVPLPSSEEAERRRAEIEALVREWEAASARIDEEFEQHALTWVNTLGLAQTDAGVWRGRLATACVEGVWEPEVARRLAAEYIAEDLAVSIRAEGTGAPDVHDAAQALWIMAIQVCRDSFPPGASPPGAGG